MGLRPHYLPDVVTALTCFGLLAILWWWASSLSSRKRRWARLGLLVYAGLVGIGAATAAIRVSQYLPNLLVISLRALGIILAFTLFYSFCLIFVLRRLHNHDPSRRRLLKATATAAAVVPAAVGAFAYIKREELTFREVEIRIPDLPPGLNGLRLVQLTDIHLSPLVSEQLLERAVGMANETKAHLAVVTGDLVSRRGDPLDNCLLQLGRLRSDAGTYGCMGNHEVYAGAQNHATIEGARLGIRFLRSQAQALRFGDGTLNLVGVDYQRKGDSYLTGVERLVLPNAVNLLLSHNPDVFPVAARQGFDLTIAGHTHGGQVNFEVIHPRLNICRFFTPFVYGLYEDGPRSLYVSRGIGTIGVPARLNAPPEVALIRLCAISS